MIQQNKQCYPIYECKKPTTKVWYTHYKSYIVKSWIEEGTNKIYEEKIPYNQPSNMTNFLANYFKNDLN